MTDRVRVDKWLWAVRVYKTRTRANEACVAGQVKVNGEVVKPAARVRAGDVVAARRGDRLVVYSIVETIGRRVSAARAAECVEDRSPPRQPRGHAPVPGFARRDRGAGRPTKRDRRLIQRLRGRA
ncbi:MAG: RNA-binding S4 domain-containing protein [Acidimicrobiales bacterium]